MSKIVYNLFIFIYSKVIWIFSFRNAKARRFIEGRRNVEAELLKFKSRYFKKLIWVHVSSLGEYEQCRPLLEALRKRYDKIGIVLSFFSPSGFEFANTSDVTDLKVYLPMDLPSNCRRFLNLLRPDLALFVKYDFWYNYLSQCVSRNIAIVYTSVIFRPEQVYFNRARRLFLPLFRSINFFFLQDELSGELLSKHKISQYKVVGDTRFDRVLEIKDQPFHDEIIARFAKDYPTLVCGSIWPSDLEVLENVFKHFSNRFRYIVAPHNLDDAIMGEIANRLRQFGKVSRLSKPEDLEEGTEILVVDKMGILSKIYRYAKYTYVGGAFKGGVHNVLEAAVYGSPVFIGDHPTNRKYNEVMELLDSGALFTTAISGEEAIGVLEKLEESDKAYEQASKAAAQYVTTRAGATKEVMTYLSSLLE